MALIRPLTYPASEFQDTISPIWKVCDGMEHSVFNVNLAGEARSSSGHPFYTIGYSTLALSDFIALLRHYDVILIADVRAFPYSRRNRDCDGTSFQSLVDEDHGQRRCQRRLTHSGVSRVFIIMRIMRLEKIFTEVSSGLSRRDSRRLLRSCARRCSGGVATGASLLTIFWPMG